MKKRRAQKKKKAFVVGVDMRTDGETRITKGDDYLVHGGTEKSHEQTVEIVHDFSKKLQKHGADDPKVASEILGEVMKKKGYVQVPKPDPKAN